MLPCATSRPPDLLSENPPVVANDVVLAPSYSHYHIALLIAIYISYLVRDFWSRLSYDKSTVRKLLPFVRQQKNAPESTMHLFIMRLYTYWLDCSGHSTVLVL